MNVQVCFTVLEDQDGFFVEITAEGINMIRVRGFPSAIELKVPRGHDVELVPGVSSLVNPRTTGFGVTRPPATVHLTVETEISMDWFEIVDLEVRLEVVDTLDIDVTVPDDFENWSYTQTNEVVGMFYDAQNQVANLLPDNSVKFILAQAPAGFDWDPYEPVIWGRPTFIGGVLVDEPQDELLVSNQGGKAGSLAFLQISNPSTVPPERHRSPDPTLVNRGPNDVPDAVSYCFESEPRAVEGSRSARSGSNHSNSNQRRSMPSSSALLACNKAEVLSPANK